MKKIIYLFVILVTIPFVFSSVHAKTERFYLTGCAPTGHTSFQSLTDGPAVCFETNQNRSSAKITCENKNSECFSVGEDKDGVFVDVNFPSIIAPLDPNSQSVWLVSQSNDNEPIDVELIYSPN